MSTPAELTPGIVWHAVSAVLAWGVLAPLCQIPWRLSSSSGDEEDPLTRKKQAFATHRILMTSVFILTLQAYIIALYSTSSSSSSVQQKQHPALASVLLFLCMFQASLAYFRPPAVSPVSRTTTTTTSVSAEGEITPVNAWHRRVWRVCHVATGVGLVFFGLYIIQHSVRLFDVRGWLRVLTFSVTAGGTVVATAGLIVSLIVAVSKGSDNQSDVTTRSGYERVVQQQNQTLLSSTSACERDDGDGDDVCIVDVDNDNCDDDDEVELFERRAGHQHHHYTTRGVDTRYEQQHHQTTTRQLLVDDVEPC